MNIKVCIPSYKRPFVETLKYIPFAKVYVDESEYDEYVEHNPSGSVIVKCKKGIQGNLCRIRNYILRTEFENGADVVIIVDDDMKGLSEWQEQQGVYKLKKVKIKTDDLMFIFEKYSLLCEEFGYKMWGVQCNQDAMSYMEYNPFGMSRYLGGPFQAFLKGNECFYDERLPLKEDYDMTIQQCNRYRGCLRVNFITYDVKQAENVGGCATYRNIENEKKQFELLQEKWGGSIVRMDKSNKGRSKKIHQFDFNPIIKIPIGGC